MKLKKLIVIGVIIVLSSCQRTTKQDYVNWVRNNLREQVTTSLFTFDAQYKPNPYVVFMQEGKDVTPKTYHTHLENLKGITYFDLKISMTDPSKDILTHHARSKKEKKQRLNYFSFDFQKVIYLEKDGKKIPCSRYHFEHSYDLTNQRNFVVGFETDDTIEYSAATLIIESAVFGDQPVKISFDQTTIPIVQI